MCPALLQCRGVENRGLGSWRSGASVGLHWTRDVWPRELALLFVCVKVFPDLGHV